MRTPDAPLRGCVAWLRDWCVLAATLLCVAAHAAPRAVAEDIEIPFTYWHGSIVVAVRIGGHGPYDMLLDTGVDPSVVDVAVARDIGLTLTASDGTVSGGGSGAAALSFGTRLSRVELGALRATRVDAVATDLSGTSEAMGRPLAGVLGYSLMKGRIVQFDYPHHVVRFLARAPARRAGSVVLPFRHPSEILIDAVRIDGKKVVANLDTGSNANLQMAPAAVRALGLAGDAATGEATRSTGFNGAAEHRSGKLRELTLGDLRLADEAVVYLGPKTGHDDEPWGLRIGNGFLERFVVTVDYRHRRIVLERP